MAPQYLARVAAASLTVFVMTGCASGAQSGSIEVEVRTMVPGDEGGSYDVTVIGPDGVLADAQEVSVGSTYGMEGVPFGWISVDATSGCTARQELTSESPTMRMVIDGKNCILTD